MCFLVFMGVVVGSANKSQHKAACCAFVARVQLLDVHLWSQALHLSLDCWQAGAIGAGARRLP